MEREKPEPGERQVAKLMVWTEALGVEGGPGLQIYLEGKMGTNG